MTDAEELRSAVVDDSWRTYRYIADNSIDVVLEADLTTQILWVSPSVEEVLGWHPDEVVGRSAPELVHPDDMPEIGLLVQAMNEQAVRVRTSRVRMLHRDGTWKGLQLRGRPALDGTGSVVGHIITFQDTTERDDALRALAVLSEGNRVIATSDTKTDLLESMCEAIVVSGEYPLAWFGRPEDDEAKSVTAVAIAGSSAAYARDVTISWADRPEGAGPTGRCIRSRATVIVADTAVDESFAPWRDRALAHGLRSSIALPVTMSGELAGALMVYSASPNAFDSGARQLFETLASDLGLGLERLRGERLLSEQAQRLAESERRYRLLAEHSSDVVLQAEVPGSLVWASESVAAVLGWAPASLVGRGLDLVHPDDAPTAQSALDALAHGQEAAGELRLACADGTWRWMGFVAHRVDSDSGEVDIYALRDIDAEIRARTELDFILGHDPLTGMVTRPTMVDRIGQAVAALRGSRSCAVICVGVDRLSYINEAFTHSTGDLVLTTLAKRIVETVGNADRVGRGTGVEFLVLIPDLATGDGAVGLAEKLLLAAHAPVAHRDGDLDVTVSIGIAIGDRGSDPDQLVRDASAAMGQAKADGRDRYAFADPTMADQARRRLDVEHRIRVGLDEDRFVANFQPIVDLATGQLSGYESLVRYRRDDGSLAGPDRFLPIAESAGLVSDIDLAVLAEGLEALRSLPDAMTVSVNVSIVTLTKVGYPERLRRLILDSGVRPARLHLEVTETALLGSIESIVEAVGTLAGLGVRWYVDDFGTGYSSISHLRDLPISGLKLDVSFSRGIREGDEKSARLANALVGLARGLGLDTVAEGIETEDEARILLSQGWRHGQGFLYGRGEALP